MRSTTSLRRMLSDIAKQRRVSRLGVAIKVKEFLRQDTAVFPDSVQTIKLLVAEGNLVAAWTTYEGTQQGLMGPFHLRVATRNLISGQCSVSRAERSRSGG
jgi:predicted ester cyclase